MLIEAIVLLMATVVLAGVITEYVRNVWLPIVAEVLFVNCVPLIEVAF